MHDELSPIYLLELPDHPYVTANSRTHWSVRSRNGRAWRDATATIARAQGVPHLGHAFVVLEMHPKDRRRRDADNLVSGVLKHVLDGLVDADVIDDDTPDHVTSSMPQIVPPTKPLQGPHCWFLYVADRPIPTRSHR